MPHPTLEDVEINHLHGTEYEIMAENPNTLIRALEQGVIPGDVIWDGLESIEHTADGRPMFTVWIK